ncbi:MAG TPA: protein translocase subunit SecF [Steroidobacteraceae bacterium]|jgi:preprotein translocase subunit SecF|nr:protein translocase subunit SecF [Steroidobacteraceae bacterium]
MEFFHKKTSFPFMATRKVWYTLSAILMIGSFISFYVYGLNFAIDFTGGISVEANFPKQVSIETVRKAVVGVGFHDPQVSYLGSTRDVTIGLQHTGQSAEQVRPLFQQALTSIDPAAKITALEVVGPQVGDELRSAAIQSMAATLFLIGIYIWFRFHTWRLSLGAIFAVLHDPILVLGVFSITQTKFDLAVVAAILAVIGYSLNDTVIVFDRIRENFEKNRRLASDLTLDNAVNQTLSRTIMTKVTTSIVIVTLLLLGGEALRGFSEALLIGIVAGTYSSIWISSAVALSCGLKAEHLFPTVHKDPIDQLP